MNKIMQERYPTLESAHERIAEYAEGMQDMHNKMKAINNRVYLLRHMLESSSVPRDEIRKEVLRLEQEIVDGGDINWM